MCITSPTKKWGIYWYSNPSSAEQSMPYSEKIPVLHVPYEKEKNIVIGNSSGDTSVETSLFEGDPIEAPHFLCHAEIEAVVVRLRFEHTFRIVSGIFSNNALFHARMRFYLTQTCPRNNTAHSFLNDWNESGTVPVRQIELPTSIFLLCFCDNNWRISHLKNVLL